MPKSKKPRRKYSARRSYIRSFLNPFAVDRWDIEQIEHLVSNAQISVHLKLATGECTEEELRNALHILSWTIVVICNRPDYEDVREDFLQQIAEAREAIKEILARGLVDQPKVMRDAETGRFRKVKAGERGGHFVCRGPQISLILDVLAGCGQIISDGFKNSPATLVKEFCAVNQLARSPVPVTASTTEEVVRIVKGAIAASSHVAYADACRQFQAYIDHRITEESEKAVQEFINNAA